MIFTGLRLGLAMGFGPMLLAFYRACNTLYRHSLTGKQPQWVAEYLDAVRDGIAYITEDRKVEGFFETMSIAENLYAGLLAAGLERRPYVSLQPRASLRQNPAGHSRWSLHPEGCSRQP